MKRRSFVTAGVSLGAMATVSPICFSTDAARPVGPVTAISGAGKPIELAEKTVRELGARLRGPLLLKTSPEYDSVRRVWNKSFDRRPALIARCMGAADVIASVQFAQAHDLLVAVRCGGHSASGKSSCDDGLMIDLSLMRDSRVDPVNRVARVGGGALLRDLDRESQAFGLVTTTGTVSHTGVGGLTLGGGIGTLVRKYGMTIDNLLSADVVTASGQLLRASATDNADLFWGIRGGGGNFGVATSFEFRLHDFGTRYHRGECVFAFADAPALLKYIAETEAALTDDQSVFFTLVSPPDNSRLMTVSGSDLHSLDATRRLMEPLLKVAKPLAQTFETVPYLVQQSKTDERESVGGRGYMKAGFIPRLSPALIESLLASCATADLPIPQLLAAPHLGGVMARVESTATAFPYRDARYALLTIVSWPDATMAEPAMRWARNTWRAVEPATRGVYSNFLSPDDTRSRVLESFGTNYERMRALKTKFDATNLFRLNANVEPRPIEPTSGRAGRTFP
jgi:FAD/FMN-containing dehydrogenase